MNYRVDCNSFYGCIACQYSNNCMNAKLSVVNRNLSGSYHAIKTGAAQTSSFILGNSDPRIYACLPAIFFYRTCPQQQTKIESNIPPDGHTVPSRLAHGQRDVSRFFLVWRNVSPTVLRGCHAIYTVSTKKRPPWACLKIFKISQLCAITV